MPLSKPDALRIHAAIHGSKDSVKLASGQVLPVAKTAGKLRCVKDDTLDINACEQNKGKPSKWTDMAKAGSKITWFLGGPPQKWGRVVDGAVDQCGAHIEESAPKAKAKGKAKAEPAKAKAEPAKAKAKAEPAKAKAPAKAAAKKANAKAPAELPEEPPKKKAKSGEAEASAQQAADAGSPAAASAPTEGDPLALAALFAGRGHGAAWEPLLRPVIEKLPNAASFIGPIRSKQIVPVRELTLQALKPNPPSGWRVISLGQSPYPRVESATGIAHFDNSISSWEDGRFGAVVSMRNIIKGAAMLKYGIPKATPHADVKKLLRDKSVVGPSEWFQAMLTQGVLFMNAACTLLPPEDKSIRAGSVVEEHTKFWTPVIQAILGAILAECKRQGKGIVFSWWGGESLKLKKELSKTIFAEFPEVKMEHVEHKNPAAMKDAFLDEPNVFGAINGALKKLGLGDPIDWLPSKGWQGTLAEESAASAMGDFIAETKDLHKMYLERLKDGLDSATDDLVDITGVGETPVVSLKQALEELQLTAAAEASTARAQKMARGPLSVEEAAAIHMYTTNHLYKKLNEALRSAKRATVQAYFFYLRLLLTALAKLPFSTKELYRGVALDLSPQYSTGTEVTWWAVSSCTPDLKVANSFGGGTKASTLFKIKPLRSVGIRELSEYKAEEEFVLAPGTQFLVEKVERSGKKVEVSLRELDRPCRVR